jgi:shikimate kinase
MKENIAIIGFMGSGKTTVGEILAKKLGWSFFDLDRIIELSENRKIAEIFNRDGEDYFRDLESKIIRKTISNNKNCVFACGGGVVLKGENMRAIGNKCHIAYLMVSPREAANRLKKTTDRPLLQNKDSEKEISELLRNRLGLYEKYAEITIDTDISPPKRAADQIKNKLEKKIIPCKNEKNNS